MSNQEEDEERKKEWEEWYLFYSTNLLLYLYIYMVEEILNFGKNGGI